MSEKAPLGLGSNFDSSEAEKNNAKVNESHSFIKETVGKYGRAMAILGLLTATPVLDQVAEAQSSSSILDDLKKLGDLRVHDNLKYDRELADSYKKEVKTLIESGKDSLGEEFTLDMVKDLGRTHDRYYRRGLDGRNFYLFEKMGAKEDLVTLKGILLDIKSSVIEISEFYEIDKGPNKEVLIESIKKFDDLLNALDKVINSK